MTEATRLLFDRYCAFTAKADRADFALEAPRLLWSKTVAQLAPYADAPGRRLLLEELELFRRDLLSGPDRYPVGPGPIERVVAKGLPAAELLRICRSEEVQRMVAPPYLQNLASHGVKMASTDDWAAGTRLSWLAAETALAFEPRVPPERSIEDVVLHFIAAATSALKRLLDDSVFSQAMVVGTCMLERAQRSNNAELAGLLCQNIGALCSDIWTVIERREGSVSTTIDEWLARPRARTALFEGLDTELLLPGIDGCLKAATAWFYRAVTYRSGASRGLSYKAIVQTEHFRSAVLGKSIDDIELQRLCGLAEELLIKHKDASMHLDVLASIRTSREMEGLPPGSNTRSGGPVIVGCRQKRGCGR